MALDEEELGDKVCSEVNAFLRKVDEDADCAKDFHLAKFVFNVPQEETGKAGGWVYGGGFGPIRGRTRYAIAEVNISPKINISAQPLKKALHKTPEVQ